MASESDTLPSDESDSIGIEAVAGEVISVKRDSVGPISDVCAGSGACPAEITPDMAAIRGPDIALKVAAGAADAALAGRLCVAMSAACNVVR